MGIRGEFLGPPQAQRQPRAVPQEGSRQGTELLGRASGEQSLEGARVLLLESVSNLVGNLVMWVSHKRKSKS